MGKDPAFLFYSSDFYIGTMMMTDEQVGKYIRLLCVQHQHGHLSEKDIMKICVNHDEDIFSKFQKDEDGKYFNARLETEADKRANFAQSRRDNRSKVNNSCTCIYLILNEDTGLVKVGSSNNPDRRIIELKNQLGTKNLTMIAHLKDANQTIETEIHQKYKVKRSLNEWYSLDDKDISEIISHHHMNNHMIEHMENEDEIENTSTDSIEDEPIVVPKLSSIKVPKTKVPKEEAEPKPYEEIIDYLNQRAGTHFSYKSPATQKLIDARLKDYTVEDFRTVIEKKCKEWLDTEMAKYIKPETLFAASHFDGYLNQLVGTGKSTYGKQPEFNMITELKKMYEEEEKKENDKTRNNGNAGCF